MRQLRAQQMAQEVEREGELDASVLRPESDDANPSLFALKDEDHKITDQKEAKARAMAKDPILFSSAARSRQGWIAKSIARALGREYVRVAPVARTMKRHSRTPAHVRRVPGRIVQNEAGRNQERCSFSMRSTSLALYQRSLERAARGARPRAERHFHRSPRNSVRPERVLFIATANFVQNIPGPLLDRMEVVDFAGYTEREKSEIAKKYLIRGSSRSRASATRASRSLTTR